MKKNAFLDKLLSKDTVYIIVVLLLSLVIVYLNNNLILICISIFVFTVLYAYILRVLKRNEIERYIDNLTFDLDAVTKDTLLNFQMPLVIIETDGDIIWKNSNFDKMDFDMNSNDNLLNLIKEFKQIKNSTNENTLYTQIELNNRIYDVYGNVLRLETKHKKNHEYVLMMYFMDKTEYINLIKIYNESNLCIGIISIDNYEELMQSMAEDKRAQLSPIIGKMLRNSITKANGIVIEKENSKFVIIFEKAYLQEFIDSKFEILEDVKKIDFGTKTPATISGGIVLSDETINEKYINAFSALDVALGRGGDQIVLKRENKYEFFGGVTVEVEKRTKVRTRVVAQALQEFMQNSKNIIIMGHKDSDVDVIGAALGLYRLGETIGKETYIVLDNIGNSVRSFMDKVNSNGKYDNVFINKNEALSRISPDTLLIVVDTQRTELVEVPELLNETENIVVIDHHRRATDIIENQVLTFQEVYASSTCELITELIQYSDLKINLEPLELEGLYGGIMIDTKNFTLKSGVRTFEAAAYLRKQGVDISAVNLLFKTDINTYLKIAEIVKNMEILKEHIGISICNENEKDALLVTAQASDEILTLNNIYASFVLCNNQNKVYISARSNGNINVQVIMEQLGGGGHLTMAGAQLTDISLEEAKEKLKDFILNMDIKIE